MIKTTGKEFKEFYGDDTYWPSDMWVDDVHITADDMPFDTEDLDKLSDNAVVRIYRGIVFYDQDGEKFISFTSFFKRWRDKRNSQTFIISVPHADVGILKTVVKNHKWKLI